MTIEQIQEGLIESRNHFLFSINQTVLDYEQVIKMTDKVNAIMSFFKENLPSNRMEPKWGSDPECYCAGTIWIEIYFDRKDERYKSIFTAGSDLRAEYRKRFPEESRIILPRVRFNKEE